jgi:hypothetical protein
MSTRDELAKAATEAIRRDLHGHGVITSTTGRAAADAVVVALTSDITDAEIEGTIDKALFERWQPGGYGIESVRHAVNQEAKILVPIVRAILAQQAVTKDAEIERARGDAKAWLDERGNAEWRAMAAERDAAYAKGRADLIAEATSDEAIERAVRQYQRGTEHGYAPGTVVRDVVRAALGVTE